MPDDKKTATDDGLPDEAALVTLLDEHNKRAIGYMSDEVSVDQDNNLDRYLGKPYGDEEEGRSNAVSMDVAEVVDWALPDLLEPFISGDRVVEFEPSTQADEAWCDQASDLANHAFFRDNAGLIVLHDAVKTALIQKIGIIKTVWEEETKRQRQTMTGLSRPVLEELHADDAVTIENVQFENVGAQFAIAPEAQAAYADGRVYTVTLTREVKSGTIRIYSVPPEQFKVSARASQLANIEYCCHEVENRRSELIAKGFDSDLVMSATADKGQERSRSDTRFDGETRSEGTDRNKLSEPLLLLEEYLRADLDGEGEKVWQIFRVGKTILGKDEVSEHPFDAWSPDRIPNRLIGLALADKVKQTQKIKTHLTRNMLDNVYLANNPRTEVPEAAIRKETIADLLDVRIGGLIRTKQGGMLRQVEVPDRSATALQAITYMDMVREQQSGVTRNGAALSAETLDPKSATQVRKEDRNEKSRKRLMARMLAETLLVPVFRKVLSNIVRYQDAPRTIELRGSWVQMDPRGWNADLKARASVGLGFTNRDEDLAAGMTVGELQMAGKQLGLVEPKHLYATAEKVIKAVGWSFPEKYFTNPSTPEGQQALAAASQQQPDPKTVEAQARMQIEQQKAQHGAQLREAEMQARMREAEMKAEMERQIAVMKADNERQIAQLRIAAEQQSARERLGAEMQLAEWKAELEARTAVQTNGRGDGIGATRFGGQVG
ncbi:MAG: hypothetical protein IT537_25295 [Hyphomicrobiales bacterium]|nr:hypothetical protein [Hyphomicrobiales bacterium]